jgi:hypothetical protein
MIPDAGAVLGIDVGCSGSHGTTGLDLVRGDSDGGRWRLQ